MTELEHAIDKVAADEMSTVDVERMCRLADRVEFLRLRTIGAYDRSGDWRVNDYLTTASCAGNTTANNTSQTHSHSDANEPVTKGCAAAGRSASLIA